MSECRMGSVKWMLLLFIIGLGLENCNHKATSDGLSPEESLKHFRLADDRLEVRLVASEPLIQAPVAMTFDERGRIWAVEMIGYMPDTAGTNQYQNPNGKIVILEDKNGDGVMDTRKVFMDSLILPRAISFFKDGLLLAEPPNLWYVKMKDDKPVEKILVDSLYAVGGSVEHQPNGLLRGVDNWFYSAKSDMRYRFTNGRWQKEKTHFRGQWGITQDDQGRLFYNNNSVNLLGDYFLPGLGSFNPDQQHTDGYDENIVPDNRTYPIHATPGVNRGYQEGILDDSLRLVDLTAACGPVVYESPLLGRDYFNNAFVAEPAGNLIKRNILSDSGFIVSGRQAYQGQEFLASDDERFRPTNLYDGPDGGLYVVDMYRGIIQDVAFLTSYLKNHIAELDLQHPLNRGRIYKIVPKGAQTKSPNLSSRTPADLVDSLGSTEPWIRETAQRLIVDGTDKVVAERLRSKVADADFGIPGRIRAFWCMDGLGELTDGDITVFLKDEDIRLRQQAIAAMVGRLTPLNVRNWWRVAAKESNLNDNQMAPYLGFLGAQAMQVDPRFAEAKLRELALKYVNDRFVTDAVISGLHGKEASFLESVRPALPDTSSVLFRRLEKIISNVESRKNELKTNTSPQFAAGRKLYSTYCQACHGNEGEGIRSLGPPLSGSQWVTGDQDRALAIVLYGFTGPVVVGSRLYKEPEIGGEMPAFSENSEVSDADIAQILSFVRNSWGNQAPKIEKEQVSRVRKRYAGRRQPFTANELK